MNQNADTYSSTLEITLSIAAFVLIIGSIFGGFVLMANIPVEGELRSWAITVSLISIAAGVVNGLVILAIARILSLVSQTTGPAPATQEFTDQVDSEPEPPEETNDEVTENAGLSPVVPVVVIIFIIVVMIISAFVD